MFSFPDYSGFFWLAATAAVLLTGISKGGFGSGIGVAATPIIALTISAAEAAALLLPLLLIADAFAVRQYHRQFDKANLMHLLAGAMVGIGLGWFFFGHFSTNERVLKLGIGILALTFVLFQLFRSVVLGSLEKSTSNPRQGAFWGAVSGFTSTLAHVGGPPVLIHLMPQKLPREIFVGTTVIFFTIINLVKLVPYSQLGLLRIDNLSVVLILAPLAWVGVKIGVMLNRKFSEDWFNRVIYFVLTLTAIQLIIGRNIMQWFF